MLDKKEVKKIIEITILAYRCGLDEINEIYVDEAEKCKGDKVKLAELSRKSFLEEIENKKAAVEYGVVKICKLQPKNQVVIAEGKLNYDGISMTVGNKDLGHELGKYADKKIKLLLEVEDDK